jgi:hypothetical protein
MKIIFDETVLLPTIPVAYKACCYPMAEADEL